MIYMMYNCTNGSNDIYYGGNMKMKRYIGKQMLCLSLVICLALTLLPTFAPTVSAQNTPPGVWVGGVQVDSGTDTTYWRNHTNGSNERTIVRCVGDPWNVKFTPANGTTPATLTLDGLDINKTHDIPHNGVTAYTSSGIYSTENLNIVLQGEKSKINIQCYDSIKWFSGIYVCDDNYRAERSLKISGGSIDIEVSGRTIPIAADGSGAGDTRGIYITGSLTIENSVVNITTGNLDGAGINIGIQPTDDFIVKGSTVTATAGRTVLFARNHLYLLSESTGISSDNLVIENSYVKGTSLGSSHYSCGVEASDIKVSAGSTLEGRSGAVLSGGITCGVSQAGDYNPGPGFVVGGGDITVSGNLIAIAESSPGSKYCMGIWQFYTNRKPSIKLMGGSITASGDNAVGVTQNNQLEAPTFTYSGNYKYRTSANDDYTNALYIWSELHNYLELIPPYVAQAYVPISVVYPPEVFEPTATPEPTPTPIPILPKITVTKLSGNSARINLDTTVPGMPFAYTYVSYNPLIKQPIILGGNPARYMMYKVDYNGKSTPTLFSSYSGKTVRFIADDYGDYSLREVEVPNYIDVEPDAWYVDYAAFAVAHGLMLGVSDIEFDPDGDMTIGQFAVILSRMAGEDIQPDGGDEWYAPYMQWLYDNAIVFGELDGSEPITREMLAYMLTSMNKITKLNFVKANLADYPDANKVSDWAKVGVQRMVSGKVMRGREDGSLDPQGTASRAEVAAMLRRYVEYALR